MRKTNRVVIVEEGWPHGGVGANLAALIQEQAFDYLDAPIQRVTGADVPMPYSKRLEQSAIPHSEHVVSAVMRDDGGSEVSAPWLRRSSCRASPTRWRRAPILGWMKSVGDEVAVGDELVEIETDKANMVYEADTAGTLIEIVAEEGATLPIGEVIARIGEAGEAPGDATTPRNPKTPRIGATGSVRGRPPPAQPPTAMSRLPRTPTTAAADFLRRGPRTLPSDDRASEPAESDGRGEGQGLTAGAAHRQRPGASTSRRSPAPAPAGGSSRRTSRARARGAPAARGRAEERRPPRRRRRRKATEPTPGAKEKAGDRARHAPRRSS